MKCDPQLLIAPMMRCISPVVTFEILGTPQVWQRAGRVGDKYFPRDMTARNNLVAVGQKHAPPRLWTGPLGLIVMCFFERPGKHYKGKDRVLRPDAPMWYSSRRRHDFDNLAKLVMDAYEKIFWDDDGRICMGTVLKLYSEKPRTAFLFGPIKGTEQ